MEYEFRGNTDFLKPYKGKNSEIILQINIVAPGAKANWLSMILLHDSVLTPLRVSSLFIANQYHSKCVLSFQTRRCAEPDIHYVDKVIFIRWYFVGQTMVDNVCGDRKQVIAVNDPNSSLNYSLVHTNKMAVQLSHTYYDYQLSCMITDHWSVYWYYCWAIISSVMDTSATCFYLCSPNCKYLHLLSFMAVKDKFGLCSGQTIEE